MAFTVEDGTGLSGSNSYITEAFFRAHHTDRGRNVESLTQKHVEVAAVRASDYLDKRFGKRFRGSRRNQSQAMEWPRLDAFDNDDHGLNGVDDVPRQLQKAAAEYALRAHNYGELAPDIAPATPRQDLSTGASTQSGDAVSGQIKKIKQKVDVIEESKEYATTAELSAAKNSRASQSSLVNDFNIPEYPEADMWLEELLGSTLSRTVVRGS